jgi:hypothetical protein
MANNKYIGKRNFSLDYDRWAEIRNVESFFEGWEYKGFEVTRQYAKNEDSSKGPLVERFVYGTTNLGVFPILVTVKLNSYDGENFVVDPIRELGGLFIPDKENSFNKRMKEAEKLCEIYSLSSAILFTRDIERITLPKSIIQLSELESISQFS